MTSKAGKNYTAVIIQPCFFPWRGQFDLLSRGNETIFLDTVQFSKGSWYNRNRAPGNNGATWITVPVQCGCHKMAIRDVQISDKYDWRERILGILRSAYQRAPHFKEYFPVIHDFLMRDWANLADLSMQSVLLSLKLLDVEIVYHKASALPVQETDPILRLVALCNTVGASRYLSGPSAKAYIGEGEQFAQAGIEIAWMEYPAYPPYRTGGAEEYSILDLIFHEGPNAAAYIWPGGKPSPGSALAKEASICG
jgi:hypothetical protein